MGTGRSHGGPLRIGVSWVEPEQQASDLLVLAVKAAGGAPVPLLTDAASWAAEIKTLRGLVLNGGNAVDPRRYG
jgi:gamma-glutamyl-gamma-aminobutyrate hydrolase PuuD